MLSVAGEYEEGIGEGREDGFHDDDVYGGIDDVGGGEAENSEPEKFPKPFATADGIEKKPADRAEGGGVEKIAAFAGGKIKDVIEQRFVRPAHDDELRADHEGQHDEAECRHALSEILTAGTAAGLRRQDHLPFFSEPPRKRFIGCG